MNRTIFLVGIWAMLMAPLMALASPPQESDLDLLEAALKELLNRNAPSSSNNIFPGGAGFSGHSVNGSYVEGFGVIFSVQNNSLKLYRNGEAPFQSDYESIFKEFLVDYADLIDGLQAEEEIAVVVKENTYVYSEQSNTTGSINYVYMNADQPSRVTLKVSVKKKDLSKLYGGVDRKTFMEEYITSDRTDPTASSNGQSTVFLRMLQKRFGMNANSQGFVMVVQPRYEYISGLGVVVHLDMSHIGVLNSSTVVLGTARLFGQVSPQAAQTVREELSEEIEAADKDFEERYAHFQMELKEFMVKYGRSLSFLDPKERLVIKVDLPRCYNCEIPSEAEFIVSKEVINDLAKGRLDISSAANMVDVR